MHTLPRPEGEGEKGTWVSEERTKDMCIPDREEADAAASRPVSDPASVLNKLRRLAQRERSKAQRLFSRRGPSSCSAEGAGEAGRNDGFGQTPCRREVFRLTGDYYPEAVARDLILRIQEYKWLEAERAGRDVWKDGSPSQAWETAARDWIAQHYSAWRAYWSDQLKRPPEGLSHP